jgi:hypothetical protein
MAMRSVSWWQFGLMGGVILSLATLVKFVRAVIRGLAGEPEWGEAIGFAAAIFGMGFVCGLVVWAGRGLHRRIGMAGDALVGAAVMVVFFAACSLLFAPQQLGADFLSAGAPMFGFAVVIGLIVGAWTGRDIRREISQTEEQDRQPDPPRKQHWSEDEWT